MFLHRNIETGTCHLCFIMKKETELLAPAGKWEAMLAAVQNGADAIYLGETSFSARKNAGNFTWEEIEEAVKYCHIRGVKVYLALNTLISERELKDFENAVIKAADCGIDALIIQDIGAAKIASCVCPDMPLHASTQLTASNAWDVLALETAGFSRVVLSRELSEKEIINIRKNTTAELEAFVHGALCISFSGKCLMSSFIGGRSGNRGMCAQPCRQMYSARGEKGYFLSPRDLCLAGEIERMQNAGIMSFKIEGRMKNPEYVATVCSVYRKYLDAPKALSFDDEQLLKKIFVRGDGFTKGYFDYRNTPEIMNYSMSNDKISSRTDEQIRKKARETYKEGAENKKIQVNANLTVKIGENASLALSDGYNNVLAVGAMGEAARNVPLSKERAMEQISKLGNTPFTLKKFEFDGEDNVTIPVSELNALRRNAVQLLCEKRGQVERKEVYPFESFRKNGINKTKEFLVCAQVYTKEQFEKTKECDRVLVPLYLWDSITPDERCFVLLPQIVLDIEKTEQMMSKIPESYGVYASSPGMLSMAKKQGRKVYADWGVNIYNSVSATEFSNVCDGITLSPELSLSSIKEIAKNTDSWCEAICYGYQTVMTSRACLIRGITQKCDCTENVKITDKTGAQFEILGDRNTHLNTVLNSRPTFMADKTREIKSSGINIMRLVFTKETPQDVERIIKMYKGKLLVEKPALYTRGYFMKTL